MKNVLSSLVLIAGLSVAGSASAMTAAEESVARPTEIQDIEDLVAPSNCSSLVQITQAIREERLADLPGLQLCGYAGNLLGCIIGCIAPGVETAADAERVIRAITYLLDHGAQLSETHTHELVGYNNSDLAQRVNALLTARGLVG